MMLSRSRGARPPAHRFPLLAATTAVLLATACGGSDDEVAALDDTDTLKAEALVAQDLELAGLDEASQKWHHHRDRCEHRANDTPGKLLECVTLRGVKSHLKALQHIADRSNGHRHSGTAGHNRSVDYAERVLRRAGYIVTRQEFQFDAFIRVSPTVLQPVSPAGEAIESSLFTNSGSGDVTAPLSPAAGALGCEAADFTGFPAGHIALIGRGTCTFAIKATNALAAGAVGVVIHNNVEGPLSNVTLGPDFTADVSVVGITQAAGEQLAATPGVVVRLKTETFRGLATTSNLLAESRKGNPNNVVMVGAHLDSVDEGPGINDNGTGSAAILETAVQMAKVRPHNKLRFALWGAEESGLLGSEHYVANLTQEERDRIALYLNFDMVGSPNHVFFVYDGDDSDATGAGPGPAGSAAIEKVFERFYERRGLPFKGTDFSGRSDYGPFMAVGIPAGGLFTGAEGIKTEEEAALWGGTAGQQYDPCYHAACDTLDNRNDFALAINADSVAYSTLHFAFDTSAVEAEAPAPAASGPQKAAAARKPVAVPRWQRYPALVAQ